MLNLYQSTLSGQSFRSFPACCCSVDQINNWSGSRDETSYSYGDMKNLRWFIRGGDTWSCWIPTVEDLRSYL
ncbi:hypothetical protein GUJ93_ZPchr0013g34379 [Zizania palustris]|uniref:Uncharacterized protein n=1 Tax=Zizania palustris TaxID=103762 RepID=A0A8J5X5S8_ZIZPA|nr:hypothetical protein GUJ93_ZPchr0013g34379 [Zizania palustris]